jgi:hypothetical protein
MNLRTASNREPTTIHTLSVVLHNEPLHPAQLMTMFFSEVWIWSALIGHVHGTTRCARTTDKLPESEPKSEREKYRLRPEARRYFNREKLYLQEKDNLTADSPWILRLGQALLE